MKYASILFFLLLAFQNCSDVDLINPNTGTNPRISTFSLYQPALRINEQQAISADGNLLVGCINSTITLFDLNLGAAIDSKTITGTCYDISMHDNWIAVSTRSNTVNTFKIDNNLLIAMQIITRDNSSTSVSGFGESISLQDSLLVVGDRYHGINPNGREGAAFIYRKTGDIWSLQSQIISTDPGNTELFGHKVVTDGIDIYISARGDNDKGAVYVFSKQGADWLLSQKISPPENIPEQQFGFSFSVDQNHLAIAAVAVTGTPTTLSRGSVFLYEKNIDWQYKQKITAITQKNEDFFGYQVKLRYPTLAVAATQQFSTSDTGFVNLYSFDKDSWYFEQELKVPTVRSFGVALCITDQYLISKGFSTTETDTIFIYQQPAN